LFSYWFFRWHIPLSSELHYFWWKLLEFSPVFKVPSLPLPLTAFKMLCLPLNVRSLNMIFLAWFYILFCFLNFPWVCWGSWIYKFISLLTTFWKINHQFFSVYFPPSFSFEISLTCVSNLMLHIPLDPKTLFINFFPLR
jgi:hypothetical protein